MLLGCESDWRLAKLLCEKAQRKVGNWAPFLLILEERKFLLLNSKSLV